MRRVLIGLVAFVMLAYAGVGWYASNEIISGLSTVPADIVYDVDVLSIDGELISIEVPDGDSATLDVDATMGLRWDGGSGVVTAAGDSDGLRQTRSLDILEGSAPMVGPDVANLDALVFPRDPSSLGLDFESVTYPGPLGDLHGWFLPGTTDTWLIAVHGLGAGPRDMLRFVEATADQGHPTLVTTYRNDDGAPLTEDRLGTMGQHEWADLEAAIDHARRQGARSIVLGGVSMGGAIVLSFLVNSDDLSGVVGAIVEAPAADLREVVSLRSGEAIPVGGPIGDSIVAAGRFFVTMRTGIDFDAIDYVERAGELTVPILMFHGTDDATVPFPIGESLAAARPDLIEFHPVPDSAHVRAWNEDRQWYCDVIIAFLERVA